MSDIDKITKKMLKNTNKPQQKEQITNTQSLENKPENCSEHPPLQHYCQKLEEIIN